MRIALLSAYVFDSTIGGVENHIRFLGKELQRRGHEILIFKPVWHSSMPAVSQDRIDDLEIRYVDIGFQRFDFQSRSGSGFLGHAFALGEKLSFSLGARRVQDAVRSWRPDLVWQHDFFSSWLAARRLSAHFPTVLTNHQGQYLLLTKSRLGRLLLRHILRCYDAIIGPSTELTPMFFDNATTIYNGVDTNYFRPPTPDQRYNMRRRMYKDRAERFVLFCPRRWAPNKGVLYFVRAMRHLEQSGLIKPSEFLLVFAGTDNAAYQRYRSEVRATLAEIDTPQVFLGDLDAYEMLEHYQAADLVVIPSLLEAVSLSALEAMACGTPVLGTAVGGMPEVIVDGTTGYLVPPADTLAIADKLLVIVNDSMRNRIGRTGAKLVRTRYSWHVIADQTEEVLSSVVSKEACCPVAGNR